MENFAAEELYVLQADGSVDVSTWSGARPTPPWVDRVLAALEGEERCQLTLEDEGLSLQAWRLVAPGEAPSADGKILVLVRRRPAWMQGCTLTARQREISEYAAGGATVNEIASHLEISLHTVRSHLKAVYRALGVCNRVELARALTLM